MHRPPTPFLHKRLSGSRKIDWLSPKAEPSTSLVESRKDGAVGVVVPPDETFRQVETATFSSTLLYMYVFNYQDPILGDGRL